MHSEETYQRIEYALQQYRAGIRVAEISRTLGVTGQRVYQMLHIAELRHQVDSHKREKAWV